MEKYQEATLKEMEERALSKIEDIELSSLLNRAKKKDKEAIYAVFGHCYTSYLKEYMTQYEERGVLIGETYDQCILAISDAIDIFDESKMCFKDTLKWCIQSRMIALTLNIQSLKNNNIPI